MLLRDGVMNCLQDEFFREDARVRNKCTKKIKRQLAHPGGVCVCVACRSPKADVVFVIDSSGSIKSSNFLKVKNFVKNVVRSFDISNNTVRVGLV